MDPRSPNAENPTLSADEKDLHWYFRFTPKPSTLKSAYPAMIYRLILDGADLNQKERAGFDDCARRPRPGLPHPADLAGSGIGSEARPGGVDRTELAPAREALRADGAVGCVQSGRSASPRGESDREVVRRLARGQASREPPGSLGAGAHREDPSRPCLDLPPRPRYLSRGQEEGWMHWTRRCVRRKPEGVPPCVSSARS